MDPLSLDDFRKFTNRLEHRFVNQNDALKERDERIVRLEKENKRLENELTTEMANRDYDRKLEAELEEVKEHRDKLILNLTATEEHLKYWRELADAKSFEKQVEVTAEQRRIRNNRLYDVANLLVNLMPNLDSPDKEVVRKNKTGELAEALIAAFER